MSDPVLEQLDMSLCNFIRNELAAGPKTAKELKKAVKARVKEAWWILLDRGELEITRDNKLKRV